MRYATVLIVLQMVKNIFLLKFYRLIVVFKVQYNGEKNIIH